MRVKLLWPLQAPAESTGTPSGGTTSGELPATTRGVAPDLPDLPSTGGESVAPAGETNVEDDEPSIDWDAESQPDAREDDTVDEPAKPAPAAKPPAQKPAAQAPAPAPKQGEEPATPKGDTPQDTQPGGEGDEPKPQPETPEQKAAREASERQAAEQQEQEAFNSLKEFYKLPDEMAARLATEPEVVLPELAARVHQAVARGVLNVMHQSLPKVIEQVQAVAQAEEKSKEAFFSRWPGLKGHEKQVIQVGKMYRQMNPNAKPEQAIEKIGRVVLAAIGLTEEQATAGAAAAAPGTTRPAAATKPASFRPAATQGAPAPAAPPSDNIFTQMAEEFLQEDEG